MPLSALPSHLNSPEKIDAAFPDDSQYGEGLFGRLYRSFQKKTKTWFAFSYRCTEWWARWRTHPKLLFAIGGQGLWRWEPVGTRYNDIFSYGPVQRYKDQPAFYYLSRIQYFKRWHFAIQWPLIITFHIYFRDKDVPVLNEYDPETDGKLFFFYWNHFDSDLIYWMITSFYLGLNWK